MASGGCCRKSAEDTGSSGDGGPCVRAEAPREATGCHQSATDHWIKCQACAEHWGQRREGPTLPSGASSPANLLPRADAHTWHACARTHVCPHGHPCTHMCTQTHMRRRTHVRSHSPRAGRARTAGGSAGARGERQRAAGPYHHPALLQRQKGDPALPAQISVWDGSVPARAANWQSVTREHCEGLGLPPSPRLTFPS